MAEKKRGRRGRGEGTIYQRKDGRWVAELTSEDGKRKLLYAKIYEEEGYSQKPDKYNQGSAIFRLSLPARFVIFCPHGLCLERPPIAEQAR